MKQRGTNTAKRTLDMQGLLLMSIRVNLSLIVERNMNKNKSLESQKENNIKGKSQ